MTNTMSDVKAEAVLLIDHMLSNNLAVKKAWVVRAILAKHALPEFEGSDFFVVCANQAVHEAVRQGMREFDIKEEDKPTEQLSLAGWEYVRRGYLITRDGEQYVVPVEQMTEKELLQKEAELRAFAIAKARHADELGRYRESRYGAAALGFRG